MPRAAALKSLNETAEEKAEDFEDFFDLKPQPLDGDMAPEPEEVDSNFLVLQTQTTTAKPEKETADPRLTGSRKKKRRKEEPKSVISFG